MVTPNRFCATEQTINKLMVLVLVANSIIAFVTFGRHCGCCACSCSPSLLLFFVACLLVCLAVVVVAAVFVVVAVAAVVVAIAVTACCFVLVGNSAAFSLGNF